MTDLKKKILDELEQISVPASSVSGLNVSEDGHAFFMIAVDPAQGPSLEPMRQRAESTIAAIKGVTKATAVLTAERQAPDPHGMNKNPRLELPVKNIIAVASGKGGVGKSTIAAGLATTLAQEGFSVGLLDADIYGPSQPKMMGLEGQKPKTSEGGQIIPPASHGVKVMSIGFMIEKEAPLIWRGPMVQSALYQLFRDVDWSDNGENLDVLVVDMPPGTGDAQLTLAQKVPVTGAVIVSTPQDIALIDARKAIEMFRKVNVPILGLIENMSTHICTNCGHEEHIFGHGGGRAQAEALNIPFLGEVPLSLDIRQNSDVGTPTTLSQSIIQLLKTKILTQKT